MFITILIYFLFGCIVGSFLNVVIFRLRLGHSFVRGRSACLSCAHELSAIDLVPVLSFLFLRGRCRYCKTRLSWQYPMVELIAGLVFALIALHFKGVLGPETAFAAVLSCFFIVVAVYDYKHLLILDKVVFPGAVFAFLGNLAFDIALGPASPWWHFRVVSGVFGVALISGFFLLQYLVSKGGWIGFGDVKYGLLLGIAAGFPGSLVLLFIAYCVGAIAGVSLIVSGRKQLSSRLPFGTFLSFSAIITLLYGKPIVNWYMGLIGF